VIWTERASLAEDLWRYGEDDLWTRPLTASKETMDEIGEKAARLPADESTLISKALALAAIEVFEGRPRSLARERRRPQSEFPGCPRIRGAIARYVLDRHAIRARRMVRRAGV